VPYAADDPCHGGGDHGPLLDDARTAVVSCAAVSLDTTEAAWTSCTDTATPDRAMVFVTTVNCRATIQDAAYESLLKSTRQHYHQRIAQVLESQFPETAEAAPELLAYHYTEAGVTEQAVHYWHNAGQSAVQRSAHVEAISHHTKGLELLKTLPETPQRLQRAVNMYIALGASLIAVKGYAAPEV